MQHSPTACAHPAAPASTPSREIGHGGRGMSACQRGQTMLEFAVTATLVIVVNFALLQTSLIVVQQYGASQIARQTARWLAVRIDTTDSQVLTQARAFAVGLPGVDLSSSTAVTVNPSCTALSGGKCTGRSSGDAVTVTVTTPLAPVLFLPTTYGIAPFQVRFPTSLPAISYTVLLE